MKASPLVIGLLLVFTLAIPPVLPNVRAQTIDGPYTIGQATHFAVNGVLGYGDKDRGWFSDGTYWITWCESGGSGVRYSTSTDRSTWSAEATITAAQPQGPGFCHNKFDLFYDGQFVSYALGTATNDVLYRQGNPASDGTITWSAAEQTAFTATDPEDAAEFGIVTDTSRYPFISLETLNTIDSSVTGAIVTKSSTNDGTWTTAAGHPFQLNATAMGTYWTSIVQATAGKVYVMYYDGTVTSNIFGRMWSGSAWGAEETILAATTISDQPAIAIDSTDRVHVTYRNSAVTNINYVTRDPSLGTWSSPEVIYTGTSMTTPSLVSFRDVVYNVWRESQTNYYLRRVSGVWDTAKTTINTDTDITAFTDTVATVMGPDNIAILYIKNSSNPRDVKVVWLNFPPIPPTPPPYTPPPPNRGEEEVFPPPTIQVPFTVYQLDTPILVAVLSILALAGVVVFVKRRLD